MFLCVNCDRVSTVKKVGGLCVECFDVETRAYRKPEEEYYGEFVEWFKNRRAEAQKISDAVEAERDRIVEALKAEDKVNEQLCKDAGCFDRENCVWHHIGFRDAIRFIEGGN